MPIKLTLKVCICRYIDGLPEEPKKPKKPNHSEEDKKIIGEIAKRPKKVNPVIDRKPKEYDNTIDGRRAWRS